MAPEHESIQERLRTQTHHLWTHLHPQDQRTELARNCGLKTARHHEAVSAGGIEDEGRKN